MSVSAVVQLWESYLGTNKFLVGAELTMADVAFFPSLAYNVRLGFNIAYVVACCCAIAFGNGTSYRAECWTGGTPGSTPTTSICASGQAWPCRGPHIGRTVLACRFCRTPCRQVSGTRRPLRQWTTSLTPVTMTMLPLMTT